MMRRLLRALGDQAGHDLVEYAIILGLGVLGITAGMYTLASGVNSVYTNVANQIPTSLSGSGNNGNHYGAGSGNSSGDEGSSGKDNDHGNNGPDSNGNNGNHYGAGNGNGSGGSGNDDGKGNSGPGNGYGDGDNGKIKGKDKS